MGITAKKSKAARQGTRLSLGVDVREKVADVLQPLLLDAVDLYTQVKQAHWNVQGENFQAVHELFDKIAEDTEEWSDLLAERIRQLGIEAFGQSRDAAGGSRLDAYPTGVFDSGQHLSAVADRLASFGGAVRSAIDQCAGAGDADAADICTEISRACDKWLWFVESHLPEVE